MKIKDTFRIQELDGGLGPDVLVCLPLVEKKVPHGFTLRWRRLDAGGPRESFGLHGRECVDREVLAQSLGFSDLVHMTQVHENRIRLVSEPSVNATVCDGIVTGRKGLGLSVQTADCVPLLMWDSKRNVVAAVHAGWRGTLAGIASRAVRYLRKETASTADSIQVVMGPAIGCCCYEVGNEVWSAFSEQSAGASELFSPGSRGRKHFDLIEANRRQLRAEGVQPDQIYSADLCTICNNDILYSYRREGKGAGRQFGMIGVEQSSAVAGP
jgi:YfiH family protein